MAKKRNLLTISKENKWLLSYLKSKQSEEKGLQENQEKQEREAVLELKKEIQNGCKK